MLLLLARRQRGTATTIPLSNAQSYVCSILELYEKHSLFLIFLLYVLHKHILLIPAEVSLPFFIICIFFNNHSPPPPLLSFSLSPLLSPLPSPLSPLPSPLSPLPSPLSPLPSPLSPLPSPLFDNRWSMPKTCLLIIFSFPPFVIMTSSFVIIRHHHLLHRHPQLLPKRY